MQSNDPTQNDKKRSIMERGLKYINCVEEPRFISMFGNVVENTPRVATLLFKLRPFLNAESFFRSLEEAIDSLTPQEKVFKALQHSLDITHT